MLPPGRLLVIADGDLPGLLACAAAGDRAARTPRGPHLVWPDPAPLDAATPFRRRAAERQAELYGLEAIPRQSMPAALPVPEPSGPRETRLLLDAAAEGASRGVDAVVWPITAGPDLDLDRTARALDRALLVEQLVALDGAAVRLSAPYADFTDRQIADLAIDMDLPVWTCWWWELASPDRPPAEGEPRPPAAAVEAAVAAYARWVHLLRAAGWSPGPVPSAHPARPGPRPAPANR